MSGPLTGDDLKAIKARSEAAAAVAGTWAKPYGHVPTMAVVDDVLRLIAELERLKAELARVGELTRWAGWLALGHYSAAGDMREIRQIAERETGKQFAEYT